MKILAFCTYPARAAVRKATGVEPWTSPPYTTENIQPVHLEGYDLIYFRLHRMRTVPGLWFGEYPSGEMVQALNEYLLELTDLSGAIVVMANCYGATDPLVAQLYASGAGAVIAGPGPNYAHAERVIGADLLTRWLIRGLRIGLGLRAALGMAKARLRLTAQRRADKDALEFNLLEV